MRQPLSLRGQALALLSRREHSRAELQAKLVAHARRLAAAALAQAPEGPDAEDMSDATVVGVADEVASVLDWLATQGWQSDARFVEARVHSRAPRLGLRRIAQELSRHGVSLDEETAAGLKRSEWARAHAVWQRRFGEQAPTDMKERARQARFLAARGFGADVIRRVLGGDLPLDEDAS